jgi:hypothetical protein
LAEELEERTVELGEARDERARMEVAGERARLSRELDELLRRRLGALVRLADRGAARDDAAGASAVLARIESESRRTLEDMRAIVGVLRDEDVGGDSAPPPALSRLDALLDRSGGVRLQVEGNPRVLPPAVELSAYRIVEHLLDALDDSPGAEVRIRFGDDRLELAVSGRARRGAGASVERARERARLHDGSLEASVRRGRAVLATSLALAAVG